MSMVDILANLSGSRWRFVTVVPVTVALLSCAATPPASDPTAKTVPPALVTALSQADTALSQIGDDLAWAEAAGELAEAQAAVGNTDTAAALLRAAQDRTKRLSDPVTQCKALVSVAATALALEQERVATSTAARAARLAAGIDDPDTRWDLSGKIYALMAGAGRLDDAVARAQRMPEDNDRLASYKARTLHDIAPTVARRGTTSDAQQVLSGITMGLPYYAAAARTDVAVLAHARGQSSQVDALLVQAISIAQSQTDGYFVAGALRHVAQAYTQIGDEPAAGRWFRAAADGARQGTSPQHRARALSRIVTTMADHAIDEGAHTLLLESVALAQDEAREPFRYWSYYEIAGAAAFAGEFALARDVLKRIPASFAFSGKSLRAAAERDVAFGLARHRQLTAAVALGGAIASPRERVQALSRIVRVSTQSDMQALPRYL